MAMEQVDTAASRLSGRERRPTLVSRGARSAETPTSAARFRDLMASVEVAAYVKDHEGRYTYASPCLLATFGEWMGSDWSGKTDAEIWPSHLAVLLRADDDAVRRARTLGVFTHPMPVDGGTNSFLSIEFPLPTNGHGLGLAGIYVDLTRQSKTEADRDRLAIAIEQVTELVMITDAAERITYVNSAFERVTGYGRDEAVGQNAGILRTSQQSASIHNKLWAALTRGVPWSGDLVDRRKDGSLFTGSAIITPFHDADGAIESFVTVKRDLTRERALENRSRTLARERLLITDTIRSLRPGDTPEATAQAICRRVLSHSGVKSAQFALFDLDGHSWPIGFAIAGQPDPPLTRLAPPFARHLFERASGGPWIEPWPNGPGQSYSHLIGGPGVHAVACAPVRYEQRLIGLLIVGVEGFAGDVAVTEALPALVEVADLAGALIGRDVSDRTEMRRGRDHISGTIADCAFRPVFQPIVDLRSNAIVGYEALTRFDDGASPEAFFAKAAAVDLGIDLEAVTLKASFEAQADLPREAWLNLNASPEFIVAGGVLRDIIDGTQRHLVVEVTEHTAIADYPAFRGVVAALGAKVEIAVDDAGAGFASLRHILELRPAFVKLDRSLISGLESDNARQAMIVGLRHFAAATGCRLIAEGVETPFELAVLRSLEIPLGQGDLLGEPLPAAAYARA
jgi:PAS domain S-box-containing protein